MTQATLTQRPSDCECWGQDDLACAVCYLAGFEEPNPQPPEEN